MCIAFVSEVWNAQGICRAIPHPNARARITAKISCSEAVFIGRDFIWCKRKLFG